MSRHSRTARAVRHRGQRVCLLLLDEAARAALIRCRFKPLMKDGVPQEAWGALEYEWRLAD